MVISSLIIVSCGEEFLQTEPLTNKNSESYYKTPAEANEALVGCYDALQLIGAVGVAMPYCAVMAGDLCFAGTGYTDGEGYPMIDEHDKTVSTVDVSLFQDNWRNYYVGIYRCNLLISKIEQVDWSDDPEQKSIVEGEARFLRAYFYFDLVRMFERVPLLTEPTVDYVPQAEADNVYKVIAEDLLFAIKNCDDGNYILSSEAGHANKWAAEALLARVYLYYTGYYQKPDLVGKITSSQALTYLEDLISKGGYGLLDNFYNLWPAAQTYHAAINGNSIMDALYVDEANKEIVFAIKYSYYSDYSGNTEGNHWMVMNGLRMQTYPPYGYGNGWGGCSVVPEFYQSFEANDIRRESSIIAISEEGVTYDPNDDKEYTGYYTKKYYPLCDTTGLNIAQDILGGTNFMIGQYQDYYSIRYSDVLLMAAELGSSKAMEYYNKVHTRAGLDAVTGSVTKDMIFNERKFELAFEGQRYWDLLRYDGKDNLTYAAQNLSYNGPILAGGSPGTKIINGDIIKTTKGLWQIPQVEIDLSNGRLEQNPGW